MINFSDEQILALISSRLAGSHTNYKVDRLFYATYDSSNIADFNALCEVALSGRKKAAFYGNVILACEMGTYQFSLDTLKESGLFDTVLEVSNQVDVSDPDPLVFTNFEHLFKTIEDIFVSKVAESNNVLPVWNLTFVGRLITFDTPAAPVTGTLGVIDESSVDLLYLGNHFTGSLELSGSFTSNNVLTGNNINGNLDIVTRLITGNLVDGLGNNIGTLTGRANYIEGNYNIVEAEIALL